MRDRRRASIIFAALLGVHIAAVAQNYPVKPIRLIVPYPAGSTDALGRTFAQRAALGQPVVVENVPGANGAIGLARVAKSDPDGYTLSLAATANLAVSPHIITKLPYDPLKDFVPIAMLARTSSVLVVNGNLPVNSVSELVALAKANPGKLNYASIGTGSTNHLLGELLRRAAGIDIVHVPYKGNAPGLTALLTGEVDFFFFPAFGDAMPHIRSGRLRALAVADSRRSPAAPDLPMLNELGYDFGSPAWFVMVAPAGTSGAIVQRLAAEVERVNSLDEVKRFLAAGGSEPGSMGPQALAEYIAAEHARYGRIVREMGIKVE